MIEELTLEQKLMKLKMFQDIQGQVLYDFMNLVQAHLPSLQGNLARIIDAWDEAEGNALQQIREMV